MGSFRRLATPGVAVAMTVLLAACGGGGGGEEPNEADAGDAATQDSGSPYMFTGDDRTQRLEECAADESDVIWYTSLSGPIVDAMESSFREAYPDIKLEVFRGSSSDLVSRVSQEVQANQLQGDVIETTSEGFRLMIEMGIMAPFETPHLEDYSEEFTLTDEDGNVVGVGDRVTYVGFGYNTEAMPEDAVPSDLEDLLDPALKGKMGIVTSNTGTRLIGNILHQYGDEKGEEFLRQFADQDVRVEAISGSAMAELIGSGEVASSPAVFDNHIQALKDDGAPVEWVPLEPVTANVGYAGVAANASAPCSAALFLDYQLGEEGSRIYEELHYPRPSAEVPFERWVPDETFETTDEYNEATERWSALFDQLFS